VRGESRVVRRSKPLSATVALCALVLTACGSTVRADSEVLSRQASPVGGAELSRTEGARPLVSESSASPDAAADGPIFDGRPLQRPALGPVGVEPSTSPGESARAPASEVEDSVLNGAPIIMGALVFANQEAALEASGVAGHQASDDKALIEFLVADLNARGGINGRPLVPLFYEQDANRAADPTVIQEEQCAHFTQDNRVDVAIISNGDIIEECLADAGVPLVQTFAGAGRERLTRNPLQTPVSAMELDRAGSMIPGRLIDMGYLDAAASPRIGVVTIDQPQWRRATDEALVPALTAAGFPPQDVVYLTSALYRADAGQAAQDTQNAVVQFNSQGIDHVIFFDSVNGLFFALFGEQQGYTPRYSWTSMDQPNVVSQNVGSAALEDSVGVGWWPHSDVYPADFDGPAAALAPECLAKTGDRWPEVNAVQACDYVGFLEAALTSALTGEDGNLTPELWLHAVETLGTSFSSSFTYRTFFGPGRHDGVSAVRDFGYSTACSCFRYTSGLHSISARGGGS
jgi:hypothetical protein